MGEKEEEEEKGEGERGGGYTCDLLTMDTDNCGDL